MNKNPKFFICKHCGNLVEMVHFSGAKIVCCGENMTELDANTVDASNEKHLPVIEVKDNQVKVTVGSIEHPMTDAHYIQWIVLHTTEGVHRKHLKPNIKSEACFALAETESVIAAYEYCNLHGLWKTVFEK